MLKVFHSILIDVFAVEPSDQPLPLRGTGLPGGREGMSAVGACLAEQET
ncbi:hypothetical protein [Chelativorans salis]|uniref:Uncharacterized protein n=1 Tax=Chelativorans salis TaxID=2978478 RepID=A0ABT2LJG6_9HYPH|nr:hypothetical protein [Chelativorans sp. EGI FJ00035]MCT7374552.1 hypothetical protein [Chelativorans sp. EGI FJ00035]